MDFFTMSYVGSIIKESIDKDIAAFNIAQLKAALEVIPFIDIPEQEKQWLHAHAASHLEGAAGI
ncbi:hypothetical protein LJK88_39315 [Paenibacillus sp. P26]|nr:hypothetical protein LJK88_39315 [Paenibacillus sp. P26]